MVGAHLMVKLLPTSPLRLPRLRTYVPDPTDPKIFWFNSERNDIVQEVVARIMERHEADESVEFIVNDAAYHEVRRLEPTGDEDGRGIEYWRGLIRRIGRMSPETKHETLREITSEMAYDVAGNFDPRVYRFAARVVPTLLTGVMKPRNLLRTMVDGGAKLDELVRVEGPVDKIRQLQRKGTLIFVPTHSSNLDSIAMAWALYREGLAPAVYGAGKNLFANPLTSFFMHNLGAYTVDRRIKAQIYKDVLKTYSSILVERGYHSLFFPGGTRSRSGAVEQHLKLGLTGTGVEAFARNHTRGIVRPIYFVPATINYALVLEAETLIEDHLKEAGRARYIIDDDEFTQVDRWLSFFNRLATFETACIIRFGEPIDPFCNPIDDDGHSIAPGGRIVDPSTYVTRRGLIAVDHARDIAYTRELGQALAARYVRETVIMPTQLVAHVLFRRLVRATPSLDLFSRLRVRGDVVVAERDFFAELGAARDTLVAMEMKGEIHMSPSLRRLSPERLLDVALTAWDGYHQRRLARRLEGLIVIEDPTLILFYQNRLRDFVMDLAGAEPGDQQAAREIVAMYTHEVLE